MKTMRKGIEYYKDDAKHVWQQCLSEQKDVGGRADLSQEEIEVIPTRGVGCIQPCKIYHFDDATNYFPRVNTHLTFGDETTLVYIATDVMFCLYIVICEAHKFGNGER